MRGLSQTFLDDLQDQVLKPLLDRVHLDRTLDLQLRDDYLNVYYRGGNLLCLRRRSGSYVASFDTKYGRGARLAIPSSEVAIGADIGAWIEAFPVLKQAMDLYFGRHPKEEREIQQLIARDNNVGSVSRATDYYVCDIEYANEHGRFDLVAVHWPSTGPERKRASGRRLVVGEVKQGDGALAGRAGIHAHVRDVDGFLADPARVAHLKEEMLTVFNQKRAMGLMNCGRDLDAFSDEPPALLFILANHDPDKTRLREELSTLPATQHCEVLVATSSLVGYGLFEPGVRTVTEALTLPESAL